MGERPGKVSFTNVSDSGIKNRDHRKTSNSRKGYRLTGGTDCLAYRPDSRADRTFESQQERPCFASGPFENGRPSQQSSEVPFADQSRPVPADHYVAGSAEIALRCGIVRGESGEPAFVVRPLAKGLWAQGIDGESKHPIWVDTCELLDGECGARRMMSTEQGRPNCAEEGAGKSYEYGISLC
jgi:hypothetical protein